MTARPGGRRAAVVLAGLTAAVLGGTLLTAPDLVPSVVGGGRGVLAAAAPVAASGRTAGSRDPKTSDDAATGSDAKDGDHRRPRTVHLLTKAVAREERDDHDRRRSTFRFHRVRADLLDAGNVAKSRAYRCTGCTAVAVSVQVVVASDVDDVAAANVADARTLECTACTSTALAYQFVVVSSGRIELTWPARRRLRELSRQMHDVARHAPAADVTAREDALAAEVAAVLRDGVVLTDDGDDDSADDSDRARGAGGSGGTAGTTAGRSSAPAASGSVPVRPQVKVRRDRDVAHRPAAQGQG